MAFLCICPEKSLELWEDEKLHRGVKARLISERLNSEEFSGTKKVVLSLPGGGVAVECLGSTAKIAKEGCFIASITGSLQNYAYLVKKYLQEELGLPCTVTLEAIKERAPISEAALLCKLFGQLGTGLLSKLRGHFSFVIYDSKMVRVLAARDPSGSVPLFQGHLSDNTLFVTSKPHHPADSIDVVEIQPGQFKYGWRALPRKYANAEAEAKTSADAASKAALAALEGICHSPTPSLNCPWVNNSSRRRSFEVAQGTTTQLHARRSLDGAHTAAAVRSRQRTDWQQDGLGMDKQSGRADQEGWWRIQNVEDPACADLQHPSDVVDHTTVPGKKRRSRRRKRNRKAKKEDTGDQQTAGNLAGGYSSNDQSSESDVARPKNTEEFFNQLPDTFRGDSAAARMLRNLLKSSPCSVVVSDARQEDNPIVYVNANFETNTGYSAHEVVGKNCRFLQAPPGAYCGPCAPAAIVRKALAQGKGAGVKIMNYSKDGSPLWNELSVFPVRDAEGNITHHVGMQSFRPATEEDREDPKETDTALGSGPSRSPLFRSRSCSDMSSVGSIPTRHFEAVAF